MIGEPLGQKIEAIIWPIRNDFWASRTSPIEASLRASLWGSLRASTRHAHDR